MGSETLREVEKWVVKSENDLVSAKQLLFGRRRVLDTSVYHCQQAAEKILKAYLTWKDSSFRKVHDLGLLADQCITLDDSFVQIRGMADALTPFGVDFRYPGEEMEPALDRVKEALDMAEAIFNFVLVKLPEEVRKTETKRRKKGTVSKRIQRNSKKKNSPVNKRNRNSKPRL